MLVGIAGACGGEKSDAKMKISVSEPVLNYGCCDASAAVAVNSNLFLVADDEGNALRVYRRDQSGGPLQAFQAGPFLHVDPHKPETDLEGAARIGDRIYWITSHGRNREGEERESRHRFFATSFAVNGQGQVELKTVGRPYARLLNDLLREPRLRQFNLLTSSLLPPKARNGLNIEGLCATTKGELLIGFRNPIPNEQALLVPLQNPAELLEGKPAKFGDPILLDLGGRGVRDLALSGDRILIIGGPHDGKGNFHIYEWRGGSDKPRKIPDTRFKGANPEALVVYPGFPPDEFQVLSDDGTRKIGEEDCKRLQDPNRKAFRSFWVEPE